MKIRALLIATVGVAALSLAACNNPTEEKTEDEAAMSAEDAGADASATTADTSGSGSASASGGSSASSGSSSSAGASGASGGTMTSGSTTATGQVDSAIPADAPSRNTRETAGAAGAPNQGQPVPYAYSPTNPAVDAKK